MHLFSNVCAFFFFLLHETNKTGPSSVYQCMCPSDKHVWALTLVFSLLLLSPVPVLVPPVGTVPEDSRMKARLRKETELIESGE